MFLRGGHRRLEDEVNEALIPMVGTVADEEEMNDIGWVNDVYRQLNGTPVHVTELRSGCSPVFHLAVVMVSLLVAILGVVAVASDTRCLFHAFSAAEVECAYKDALILTAGVCAMIMATLGLCFSCSRGFQGLGLLTSFSVVLLSGCALISGAVAGCVVATGFDTASNVERLWSTVVALQPSVICRVQHRFRCSGLKSGQCCRSKSLDDLGIGLRADSNGSLAPCYLIASNGSAYDLHTQQQVQWPKKMCAPLCTWENNAMEQTCEGQLVALLEEGYYCALSISLALAILFALLAATTLTRLKRASLAERQTQYRF